MLPVILRRLLGALLVLFSVSVLTFFIARVVPSDPAALYAGQRPTAEQIAIAREKLGLDQPLPAQYVRFMGDMLRGEFGLSFKTRRPIAQDLRTFVPATLELALFSVGLAALIGIPLGVFAATRRGSLLDRASRLFAIAGVSIPTFWLALVLQLAFFGWLKVLPLSGRIDNDFELFDPIQRITGMNVIDAVLTGHWPGFLNSVWHLILPAIVVASYPFGLIFRMTRASMLEVLAEPYILAAMARGVARPALTFRHALKNALLPALNVLGLSFAFALTGSFLVEVIFSWPGLGKYVTDAILNVDFPVIVTVTLLGAAAYVFINLALDLAQTVLDPRSASRG